MSKNTVIFISALLVIAILWMFLGSGAGQSEISAPGQAINTENGEQRIRIVARGGYSPRVVQARANRDTVLEIETKGTYDCSSSIFIPALNYRQNLRATGIESVKIPASLAKDTIQILCSMGMYSATINFNENTD